MARLLSLFAVAALVATVSATAALPAHAQPKHQADNFRLNAEYVNKMPLVTVDGANENCASNPPAPTLTWVTTCKNFSAATAACFTPARLPSSTDVIVFPAGSNVTYYPVTVTYAPMQLDSILIDAGANFYMNGNAFIVTSCFVVKGNLVLTSPGYNQGPFQTTDFLADPNQPEGTDCLTVAAGFTPRICGPGRIVVAKGGAVSSFGQYASFFISGLIQAGGSMTVSQASFFWGNMTILGTFTVSDYAYAHGYLNILSNGSATLGFMWYDRWETGYIPTTAPLLINNQAGNVYFVSNQLNTNSAFGGTIRSLLVNHANAWFQGAYYTGTEFDMFNFGTITFVQSWGFQGIGTTLNKGVLVADASSVYLSSMHSYGGTLRTINGGSFSFGNGASNPKALKFCQLFGDNAIYRDHLSQMLQRKQQIDKFVDTVHHRQVDRLVENNVRYEKVGDRECWWYFSICYSFPYLASAPDPHLEERLPVKQAAKRMKRTPLTRVLTEVTRLVVDTAADFEMEAPCHLRYAFSRTKIEGDASSGASVVTTMPVEINDYLLVANGGRWFPIMDRRSSPFRGNGDVVIGRDGTVVASVEADFKNGGRVLVQRGGSFVVPPHAKIHFTNESLFVARGGVLHVDGQLALYSEPTKGFHDFINCGLLYGKGKVTKERSTDLECTFNAVAEHRVKKNSAWRNIDTQLLHGKRRQ